MTEQDTPDLEPGTPDTPETEPLLPVQDAASETETETAPPEEQPKYTVKLDGKEVEVEFDELVKGYQRQADYTAKTMAIAARERELAEKSQQVQTVLQQEAQRLGSAIQAAQAALAFDVQNIDWDNLLQNNPQEYLVQQRKVQQRQAQIQNALAEQQRVQAEADRKRTTELQSTVEREQAELLKAVPDWKDDTKRAAEQASLVQWAKSQGYDESILSNVVHARDVLTLRKAMLYDQMMQKVPAAKPAPTAPPPLPPVPTRTKAAPDPEKMSMEQWVKWREAQLRKSG